MCTVTPLLELQHRSAVWVDALVGFTPELLGSVWTNKGVELTSCPLSCWCGDQNVISRITKTYREMITSISRTSGLAYSWKLPLTDTAVLWKSPHSLVGFEGNQMMWWQLMSCGNFHCGWMFGQHESFTAHQTFALATSFIAIKIVEPVGCVVNWWFCGW